MTHHHHQTADGGGEVPQLEAIHIHVTRDGSFIVSVNVVKMLEDAGYDICIGCRGLFFGIEGRCVRCVEALADEIASLPW